MKYEGELRRRSERGRATERLRRKLGVCSSPPHEDSRKTSAVAQCTTLSTQIGPCVITQNLARMESNPIGLLRALLYDFETCEKRVDEAPLEISKSAPCRKMSTVA
jgi:hypothetical protein